jgi:hypothetical protein
MTALGLVTALAYLGGGTRTGERICSMNLLRHLASQSINLPMIVVNSSVPIRQIAAGIVFKRRKRKMGLQEVLVLVSRQIF